MMPSWLWLYVVTSCPIGLTAFALADKPAPASNVLTLLWAVAAIIGLPWFAGLYAIRSVYRLVADRLDYARYRWQHRHDTQGPSDRPAYKCTNCGRAVSRADAACPGCGIQLAFPGSWRYLLSWCFNVFGIRETLDFVPLLLVGIIVVGVPYLVWDGWQFRSAMDVSRKGLGEHVSQLHQIAKQAAKGSEGENQPYRSGTVIAIEDSAPPELSIVHGEIDDAARAQTLEQVGSIALIARRANEVGVYRWPDGSESSASEVVYDVSVVDYRTKKSTASFRVVSPPYRSISAGQVVKNDPMEEKIAHRLESLPVR